MFENSGGRLRWALIFWIFLLSAIAYLDRVNISIAGKAIENEFHFSNVQLGWVLSAFLLGYAFFQAPAGRIADRLGPRLVITAGVIWWGFFTVMITVLPPAFSGVLWLLIGIRFCLGVGESVVYPASNTVVASWIPSTERGIANGFIFAGVGFGSGVTSPLIAYLMTHYGWRSAFIVSAALGVLAGAVWYVIARDSPSKHPWINEGEREYIEAGLPTNAATNKSERVLRNARKTGTVSGVPPEGPASSSPVSRHAAEPLALSWGAILSNPDIWLVTFSYFTYGYAAYIFFGWFFIYLSEVRGLDIRHSSYFTMLPFLAMAIGSPVGGWISDRLTKRYGTRIGRCGIAVAGIGLASIFIALGTLVHSPQIASVVLAGGAGALYLSQSSFWSVSADIGGRSAGSVSGLMNMGGQIGGALTASATPAIASHLGWSASFLVAAALCACGALAWLGVERQGSTLRESVVGSE